MASSMEISALMPRHKSTLDIASLVLGELLVESLPVFADDLKEDEEEEEEEKEGEEEESSLKSFTVLYNGIRKQKYLHVFFFCDLDRSSDDDDFVAGHGVFWGGESSRFELAD